MIPVLVAAASPAIRAGLAAMLGDMPDFGVAGSANSASLVERAMELEPAVILWQLGPEEDAGPALAALEATPVLLLAHHPSLELIRAGARGALHAEASAEQIAAALRAVAAELVALTPESFRRPAPAPVSSILTARETEILRMIAEGLANKEIAYRLGISEHTVKFHVSALLGKLGAATRAEAIGAGIRQGIILL